MHYNFIDETGNRHGRLLVKEYAGKSPDGKALWMCECDCGNETVIAGVALRYKHTKSCGCYSADATRERSRRPGSAERKKSFQKIYGQWYQMMRRCNAPSLPQYKDYGGRGIRVCAEWHDFQKYKEWAYKNGYSPDLEIDRIDNNGNYEPGNCRYVTKSVNARNTRINRMVTYMGKTLTLVEWSEKLNLPYDLLQTRIYRGWAPERAFTQPKIEKRRKSNV